MSRRAREVLRATTRRPTAEVRQRLGLSRGDQVHEILRARSANGEPIVLEEAYLPAAIFPGMLSADLTGSLYTIMRDYDASPFSADEEIEATPATPSSRPRFSVSKRGVRCC